MACNVRLYMCTDFTSFTQKDLAEEEHEEVITPAKDSTMPYVVQGTPEAAKADLDFDLVMNASLAKNEYPKDIIEAAMKSERCPLGLKFCTPEVWEKYKDTKSSGPAKWTLARAINTGVCYPTSFMGCHAGDKESYDDFKDFYYPVIQAYHKGFDINTSKH
ncbi:predicted protein, partial [Nematostella vectensis]